MENQKIADDSENQTNKDYKILVVIPKYAPKDKPSYKYLFPTGLGIIIAILKREGYEVDCVNLNHHFGSTENILSNALDKKKYDFVCTGNDARGYDISEKIIHTTRSHGTKPGIMFGGPLLTSEPIIFAKDLDIDFGFIGEADESVVELLKTLENKGDLSKVDGIIYYKDEKPVFTNRREPPKDLDSIPFPDFEAMGFEEYLDNGSPSTSYMHSVFDNPRVYPLIGSRSCPFRCTFCWHYDNMYRVRSMDNVMEEVETRVKKYKINRIYILDECFTINKKRLTEFCERMKKLRSEISWELRWVNSFRVDVIDKDLLKMLKESGCDVISYGLESYSLEILKSMKKVITPEQIDKAIRETREAKIAIQGNFIFGDIAETKETAYETLDYWKKNCLGQFHLSFIRPYPNSEIYQHCIRKGIIKDRLKFLKTLMEKGDFVINMTENMSDEDFSKLRKDVYLALAKHRKIIRPLAVKKNASNTYDLTVKCPFCNEVMRYGNYPIRNKLSYSFHIMCKECGMRFYIASILKKLAYAHYDKTKYLRNLQVTIRNYMGKKKQ